MEVNRKRKRSESPAASVGVVHKDVCIGVRLLYVDGFFEPGPPSLVKWLKIKIPGLLLDKFQNSSSSRVYDAISMSPSSTRADMFVNGRSYQVEGPFDFKCHVTADDTYPTSIRCAPIGSVMFAMGGNQSHIQGYFDYFGEAEGMLPANFDIPLPLSTITGGKPNLSSWADLSSRKRNADNELSNSFDFCDFSDPSPEWKLGSQPLICARYRPRLVSMFGKLFAFGGNRRDSDTPFAEVFDPAVGYWQPLPEPPFEWVSDYELVVLPLLRVKRILLVATESDFQYTFDPFTGHWHRFDTCPDLSGLLVHALTYEDKARALAVYNETIYWVESSGILSMYNLREQRYQKVYVTGICSPWFGYGNGRFHNRREMVLYPFSEDLLGILWCKYNPLGQSPDSPPFTQTDTNLDLVFFRLSPLDAATLSSYYLEDEQLKYCFDDKTTTMTASVVDFLSVPVHQHVAHIFDALPL